MRGYKKLVMSEAAALEIELADKKVPSTAVGIGFVNSKSGGNNVSSTRLNGYLMQCLRACFLAIYCVTPGAAADNFAWQAGYLNRNLAPHLNCSTTHASLLSPFHSSFTLPFTLIALQGELLLRILSDELGPPNVYDLNDPSSMIRGLKERIHERDLRVVACGGDGTVNWVLSTIAALDFPHTPKVGLIPLGTGNDAARYFGWGPKLRSEQV